MRICEKNKQSIYISLCTGETEEQDLDGNYTGNIVKNYSTPTLTKVNLYPANGIISREIFGDYDQLDMMIVTIGSPFTKDDVFFLPENIATGKYDYYVSSVKKSLNNTYYALKKRA